MEKKEIPDGSITLPGLITPEPTVLPTDGGGSGAGAISGEDGNNIPGSIKEQNGEDAETADIQGDETAEGETKEKESEEASPEISDSEKAAADWVENEALSEEHTEREESQPETVELKLTPEGKLEDNGRLRELLPETVRLVEPEERLTLQELQSHAPAWLLPAALTIMTLAAAEAVGLVLLGRKASRTKKPRPSEDSDGRKANDVESYAKTEAEETAALSWGSLHNIGRRKTQQDSLGATRVQNGLFAVIADGMGGLSDGDKVSQQIVRTMLADAGNNSLAQLSGNLNRMVAHANDDVNRLLGQPEQYVSGSTLIAVLAEQHQFQWISVGDSRIYLFRGGVLMQLNREHIFEAELLNLAVNNELGFQEAHSHPKKKSVSSFIGMGRLKYVDEPLRPVPALPGDRVLLSSDGVFNTLQDEEIAAILRRFRDPTEAAAELEAAVLQRNHPYQDNFTSILIGWQ